MDYREKVRNGKLYLRLNNLLREQLPKIKTALSQELQSFLKNKQITKPLDVIYKLEFHGWGQDTQWRIEIDFDDYEWSCETMKPHCLGAYIILEEVARKKTLHFSYQIYNTFNTKILKRESEKINEFQLFDGDFIERKLSEIDSFLENLNHLIMIEVKQIDFEQLAFPEE